MVTQPGKEQEATILDQSQMILKTLGSVRSELNSAFNKQKEEGVAEGASTPINVLDEVINNLAEALRQIENIYELIVHKVIKKIV